MRFYFGICILVCLQSCNSFELKREYDNIGRLRSEIEYMDGKKNGRMILYYPDGKIKEISYFKNDTLDGLQTTFFKDGNIADIISYKKGIKDGKYLGYYTNGNIHQEGSYKNGKRTGLLYQFYRQDSGKLSHKYYLLNVRNEKKPYFYYVQEFDESGNITSEMRSININIKDDSIKIGERIQLEFELFKGDKYDSAIVIIGDFDDTFNPISSLDTILLKKRRAEFYLIATEKGTKYLRGEIIGYSRIEKNDSIDEYTTFGYFEEKIVVY